jgi:hypothetical protein
MNGSTLRLCTWSGIVACILLGIGLYPLLQFVPPPLPSANAAEIAAIYRGNSLGILIGATLMLASGSLYAPFYAAISSEMERIEGVGSPLAKAQMLLGVLAVCVPVSVAADAWMIAAFRPERSDETIQALNDFGWFLFFTPVVPGLLNAIAIAVAIFHDKSPNPTFPRWVAFANIWIGILFLPGAMLAFFKTGPFALNGIFVFWLGTGAFVVWFVIMTRCLLRAARART